MGPLMMPVLACDWCGTCAVIPANRTSEVAGLDGVPHVDRAVLVLHSLGWRVADRTARCPGDVRRHAGEPAPAPPTLTSIEG